MLSVTHRSLLRRVCVSARVCVPTHICSLPCLFCPGGPSWHIQAHAIVSLCTHTRTHTLFAVEYCGVECSGWCLMAGVDVVVLMVFTHILVWRLFKAFHFCSVPMFTSFCPYLPRMQQCRVECVRMWVGEWLCGNLERFETRLCRFLSAGGFLQCLLTGNNRFFWRS